MTAENVASPGRHPHVVLIFMDDQAFRTIGSLNNPEIHTPNLDALVRRGTAFTHAFNQGSWVPAVCVASRAMLITGTGLFHAREGVNTGSLLGQHFRDCGYRTFFTGKWHNSASALERSYDEIGPWFGGINADGFHPDNTAYLRPAPGNDWSPSDREQGRHWMERDGEVVHSSERWTDAAIDFLESATGDERSFFLHVAYHAPHDPRQTHPEFLDLYPADKIEVPPNFLPEHPFDQGDARIRDEWLAPFPRTEDAVRLHRSEYYAIISHADQQIGRILDALDANDLIDDTVVVFSSDHGLAVGEHGLMGKQNLYDHSVRVPLIFAGPGAPQNETRDALVYQSSIFPTLCDLVGIPTPATVEAPSLAPVISGEVDDLYRSIVGAYRDYQRMVRTKSHKLIAYPDQRRHQLFDIARDPWETSDLSDRPEEAERIGELRRDLERWQTELDDDLDVSPAFASDDTGGAAWPVPM
ncbi:sulfatase-like hydrolase/transferase [Microbacterium awajiense]|uniref:Sulfatase-like hydrolase/transferase n=1 Tax=Microbacterium awajiense TaxID=415214 RepID=A0ABP7AKF0_9MICO